MRIARIDHLHCDAGWRVLSFLKITSDDGTIGWSEYNECYGSKGLTEVICGIGEILIGADPRPIERIVPRLQSLVLQAPGGVNQQAIAAIENALLDLKAKSLGIPVCALFGGPVRDHILLYWSHCGTDRVLRREILGTPPIRSVDDLAQLGSEVVRRGFKALKTNILLLDENPPRVYMPCFSGDAGAPELNVDRRIIAAIRAELAAFRLGAGKDTALHIDLNFNFKTEGYARIVRALEEFDLSWVEIDIPDARALAYIRSVSPAPIASLETLYGRRDFRPYLEAGAVDVAIIDVPRVGLHESVKIASLADTYQVNVAPHNFYGHLANLMSAHFCAAVPNFRIMEIDIDDVPWKNDLVTVPPVIENGHFILPTGPGWGSDVNEKAVLAHPPKR